MIKRVLGKTNFNLGVIGFGGIPIQRLEEEKAISIVKLCLENGVNFIDTARAYGDSERLIGLGLKGHDKKCYIATKSMSKSYRGMKRDIEISLNNLDCGVIDLYQFHLVKTKEQLDKIMGPDGAYKALKEAQENGLVREIGITSHDYNLIDMALDTDYFSTIQFPYNLVERQGEELFKKAAAKNIGVIIMKPMAGGALEDGNLALRYILENPNVSVIIPGMDDEKQVIENTRVGAEYRALSLEDNKTIEKLVEELGTKFCRRCGYCLPCPQGIDIPTQFLMEGYFTRYELEDWAQERYNAMPHKSSECIECGSCEPRCPYNLPIMEMLKNVALNLEKK